MHVVDFEYKYVDVLFEYKCMHLYKNEKFLGAIHKTVDSHLRFIPELVHNLASALALRAPLAIIYPLRAENNNVVCVHDQFHKSFNYYGHILNKGF